MGVSGKIELVKFAGILNINGGVIGAVCGARSGYFESK